MKKSRNKMGADKVNAADEVDKVSSGNILAPCTSIRQSCYQLQPSFQSDEGLDLVIISTRRK